MKKLFLVTGCCGFIGSNIVDFLLRKKKSVIGIDNLSTGNKFFIKTALKNKNFKFYKIDILKNDINKYFKKIDSVFHFAANADVRYGIKNRFKDIEQNIIATYKVLEAIKKNNVKSIVFSSTGSVYGEANEIPTPENSKFPIQTSLYGTSKLSAEGLITSYCEAFGIKGYIFRFVSILGSRYTHGHIFDFVKKLLSNNKKLKILGNGKQDKSYLNVKDCISAIWKAFKYQNNKVEVYNLGHSYSIKVLASAKIISKILQCKPKIYFSGGKRGWVGDNPKILLNIKKIKKTGWKPKHTIEDSIKETVEYLLKNKWLLKKRK